MKHFNLSLRRHSTYFAFVLLALAFGCSRGPTDGAVVNQGSTPDVSLADIAAVGVATHEPPAEIANRLTDDAFRFAAYDGQFETVLSGIKAGNNVNATEASSLLTPLHMAAYNGHSKLVRLLLEHNATVDSRDHEGKTPLLHACTGPFVETVELLLAAGADINTKESTEAFTPLMMAAGLGQTDVVKILLDNRADRDALDDDGDSALQHAKNSGHSEIVELLSR